MSLGHLGWERLAYGCVLVGGVWSCSQAGVEEEDEDEDPVTPPNCVICIDGFTPWDEVRELPTCGHVFHRRCIDLWLRGTSFKMLAGG